MMRRFGNPFAKICFPLVIILIAFSQDAPAGNGSAGIERMVRQIEALFPVLEGYVLSVQGDRVAIDLKRGQDVRRGQKLKLIRYGEPITHPVTQKVIGRQETDLGEVEVTEVRKDYSLARVTTPGVQARKGDGVRSTFKKIKILVAPVQTDPGVEGNPQALGLEIETQLNQSARIQVPAFDLGVWILENNLSISGLTSPENLARLRQKIVVNHILLPRVQSIKGKTVLAYRLVSAVNGQTVKQARVLIHSMPTAPPVEGEQEVQTDFREKKGPFKFIGKNEFNFAVVDMDSGDLNGNGKREIVMIDDHRVLIFRYQNNGFKKIGQVTLRKGNNRLLSVDVADINGNGRDEIFVTNSQKESLSSFVLEAAPGKKRLVRIWEDVNRYFRVLRDFDGPPLLVSQRPDFDGPFRPGIQQIHFKNGNFEVGEALPLQSGSERNLILYGLAFGQISPAKSKETIFLDNNYKLRVYSSGGRVLVNSDEYYGHDPRMIEVGVKDRVFGEFNSPDEPQPVRFKGRLQLIRHNQKKYLLIPKNHRTGGGITDFLPVKGGSLVVLGVNREGLRRVFETQKHTGYLATYHVMGDSKSGRHKVYVVMVADQGGVLGSEKVTTVFTYDW